MKKKELRQKIVKALAKKMPDGKKQPSEIKSEAIPLDKAEQMQLLDDEMTDHAKMKQAYESIHELVESILIQVRPYVDAANVQKMFYNQMPSIMTGSRMQEVVAQAQAKYENAVSQIRGHWIEFKDIMTQGEYNEIIDDELRKQAQDIEKSLYR